MRLLRPLPADRTLDQVRKHYEVEKAIALRLKSADRAERSEIFRGMYDELFRLVPDHPRLVRRDDPGSTARANLGKLRLLQRFMKPSREDASPLESPRTFLEFAPGDCRFAFELCRYADKVYGVDISDQRGVELASPANFELILYDGFHLELADEVDLVFSDQFLEHLHPEDVEAHFRLVHRALKPSGTYVFRTPHRFNGPHDISMYFSEEPEGFHLKEWTYAEFGALLGELGFSSWHGIVQKKRLCLKVPFSLMLLVETTLRALPRWIRREAVRVLFSGISMVAVK